MHPFIKIKEMNQIRLNIFYYLLMNFHFRLNMTHVQHEESEQL